MTAPALKALASREDGELTFEEFSLWYLKQEVNALVCDLLQRLDAHENFTLGVCSTHALFISAHGRIFKLKQLQGTVDCTGLHEQIAASWLCALLQGTEAVAALQRGFEVAIATDPLHAVEDGAAEERRTQKAAVAHGLFSEMDEDGSGTLDFGEVKELCERLGKRMTDAEVHKALLAMDEDGSMEADAEEFVNWWVSNADSNAVLCEEIVQ